MWQSRNVGVDVLLVDCTRMSSDRLSVLFLFGSGALTLTERQRSGVDRHLHPHWSAVPAGKQQRRVPQRTPTSLPTACAKPAQLCVAEVHSRSEHGRRPTTSSRRLFRLRQPRQPVRSASSSSHLGIGPFLAAPSHHKCCSIDVRRPRSGSPVTMVRQHQCGVHSQLPTTVANILPPFQAASHHARWVPTDPSHERRHSSRPAPLPRGRSELPRSPEHNPAFPTLQLYCTLRGGGQKGRGDCHTDRCVRLVETDFGQTDFGQS